MYGKDSNDAVVGAGGPEGCPLIALGTVLGDGSQGLGWFLRPE